MHGLVTRHKYQPKSVMPSDTIQPEISIFLLLRGNDFMLGECLESIIKQTYPLYLIEVTILEENYGAQSIKTIRRFVKRHRNLRIHRLKKRHHQSITQGQSFNNNQVVIPIVSFTVLADDFIEKVVTGIQTSGSSYIGGRVIYQGQSYMQQAAAALLGSRFVFPTSTQDESGEKKRDDGIRHAGYLGEALDETGLLVNELCKNEYEVATRLAQKGHTAHFSSKIQSFLPARTNLFHLFGISFWHGISWANRIKKNPAASSLRYAVPSLIIMLCTFLSIGALFSYSAASKLLLLPLTIYCLYNLLISLLITIPNKIKHLIVLPILLTILHVGFGIGSIAGLATGKKRGSAIPKWANTSAVFFSDYIMINAAFFLWAYLRSELGLFSLTHFEITFGISNIIVFFWFFIFLALGLYRPWNAASRVDESVAVFKTTALGVLMIFLLTFDLERDLSTPVTTSRILLISYWALVACAVTFGRMILRTVQRALLENGIGLQRTIIVGWGKKARKLYTKICKYPALGFQVIGFVDLEKCDNSNQFQGIPLLGSLEELSNLITRHEVENVLISLQKKDQKAFMEIIARTEGHPVSLRIVPDLYSIITGQARTNQIYGFPLVEILPQYMPTWEKIGKRAIDIIISLTILIIGLPLWLLVAFVIRINSPGNVFFLQRRVGKNGKHFHILKFRSMISNAEKLTGPKWADKDDSRITSIGWFIRKWRIDEIPQFINVLRGEMSIVGPRPERPYFVRKLKKEFKLYVRRLKVQPGITGWAQVKGSYDATVDDVKQKLKYDLFYLENMSLKMDLKILIYTVYVMLSGKGQ